MPIYCDNHFAILITKNPTFHECKNHIKIDYHVIHHRVLGVFITTPCIGSSYQLAAILIEGLSTASYDSFSHKLCLLISTLQLESECEYI